MSPLATSLWITLIGMGLVFIAILLLWGLMEILMRFTARFAAEEAEEEAEETEPEGEPEALPAAVASLGQKQKAAAAAVAIAIALQRPAIKTMPSGSAGSAWQAITRSSQLNHATHIPRKSRGSVR
jgi:sodium pump decarboxylase gamma subunit